MADLNDKLNKVTDTADHTSECDAKDIQDNKVMGILAYISWLVLIPIFAAPTSKFARFHANQGIILAIASTACWLVLSILAIIPFIGLLFLVIEGLVSIVILIFAILGIVNAAEGKAKELPFIGKIKILK